MTRWILLVLLLCALGCTAVRETQPERTATEQLIISSAVVDAARQIKADAVAGKKVVVDVTYLKTVDVEFTQGELRDRLLQLGAQLVTDLDQAEVIVEARSGGLGIDESKTNIGIPSIPIPVPSVGTFQTHPHISIDTNARRVNRPLPSPAMNRPRETFVFVRSLVRPFIVT